MTVPPIVRRVTRSNRQRAQRQLVLQPMRQPSPAVVHNYLNNIEPDEVIRHLSVGTDDQYRAAQFLESAVEAARDELEYRHSEAISQLEAESDAKLLAIETALTDALDDADFERVTPAELHALITGIACRVAIMHRESCDYDDAEKYMPDPDPAPEPLLLTTAPVPPKKRGSVRPARRA